MKKKETASQIESSVPTEVPKGHETIAQATEPCMVPFIPPVRESALMGKEWRGHTGVWNVLRYHDFDKAPTDESGNPTDYLLVGFLAPDHKQEYIMFGSQLAAAAKRAGVDAFLEINGQIVVNNGLKLRLTKNRVTILADA